MLRRSFALGLCALGAVYLYGLSRTGLIGPDEPRYAAIGREMARSADWLTPVLWGEPWFEKPPLLYWLIALGNLLGLGPELAPRLPVAMVSLGFLAFFYTWVRRQAGEPVAWISTAILGTSAMWLAYSQAAVTDLPMTVLLASAMLAGWSWHSSGNDRLLTVTAGLLGLAVLAKGLAPVALALPLAWCTRRKWRSWFKPAILATFALIALPWYALSTLKHGSVVLEELVWKHHFARFVGSPDLHPEPTWFYLPVIAGAVFPWTPLLVGLFRKENLRGGLRSFLLGWLTFGLVFLSASSGKLPGYVLPLLPPASILMAWGVLEMRRRGWLLALSTALLAVVPTVGKTLPGALLLGLSRSGVHGWSGAAAVMAALLAAAVWFSESRWGAKAALNLTACSMLAAVVYMKVAVLPEIDRVASARRLWLAAAPHADRMCADGLPRSLHYGLNYYAGRKIPPCHAVDSPHQVRLGTTWK